MKLTAKQIGENDARCFYGDDVWKKWKQDYDECMAYRKTIKGKPTEEQMVVIKLNAAFIEFYGSVLFHSPSLASRNMCGCTRCGQRRTDN